MGISSGAALRLGEAGGGFFLACFGGGISGLPSSSPSLSGISTVVLVPAGFLGSGAVSPFLEAVTERLLVAPRVVAAGVGRLVVGCLDVERALRFFSIAPFLVLSLDLVVDLVFDFGAIVLMLS
jgi:hypothetical protein